MLVLTRKANEGLVIGGCTFITVASIGVDSVDIAVKTPPGFQVEGRPTLDTTVTLRRGEFATIKRVFIRSANPNWPIDSEIQLMLVDFRGDKARLGIEAPVGLPCSRAELWDGDI